MITRRKLLALTPLLHIAPPVWAQDISRPIKILVGYAPGVTPDVVTRILAGAMGTILNQNIVVENRPGAGGWLAVQELIKSPPDGNTLVCLDPGQWAVLPAIRPGLYDPLKALAPVGLAYTSPLYLVVMDTFPAKNLQDLIGLIKTNPNAYNYGSSGNGTFHHLFMESFKAKAGLQVTHVPYKGGSQALQGLLSGDIQILVGGPTTEAYVKAGKMRRLVVASRERWRTAPDVPSMSDVGMPDLQFVGDVGYFAPAGTPKPVVDRLTDGLAKAVRLPDFVDKAPLLGIGIQYKTPAQLLELVRDDIPRYQQAVKVSGAKAE